MPRVILLSCHIELENEHLITDQQDAGRLFFIQRQRATGDSKKVLETVVSPLENVKTLARLEQMLLRWDGPDEIFHLPTHGIEKKLWASSRDTKEGELEDAKPFAAINETYLKVYGLLSCDLRTMSRCV